MEKYKSKREIQKVSSGLDNLDNWFGDPRERLVNFLGVLVKNSAYSLRINTTDTTKKILELWRDGTPYRIMGIELHPLKQEVGAFFNASFYNSIRKYVVLPENQRANKKQPHITITLDQVWLVVRVATEMLD